MVDATSVKNKIITLLDERYVTYKLFQHKPILSYEDAENAQKKYGWTGTEGKSLVIKADDSFIIYFTLQGQKVNFDRIKTMVGLKKVRLASAEELEENFGAVPGSAYPFGFDEKFAIYIDPAVYKQEWVVFSPCLPTFTVQAKGNELQKVFTSLKNTVTETEEFNA